MPGTSNAISNTGIPSYEDYLNQQKLRNPSKDLGKNEFMQLLAAQMSAQDPLQPTTDTEFIAQLAQFSSLEQMQNLNTTMTSFYDYSMVGKYVHAEVVFENGEKGVIPGIVDRIVQKDGETFAQVGDYLVKTSSIVEVYDKDLFQQANPLLDTAGLIGKDVKGRVEVPPEAEGEEPTYREVSGTVTRVAVEEGAIVAYVKNGDITEKVPVANIFDIEDKSIDAAPPVESTPETGESETGETAQPGETVPGTGEIETGTEGGETP